MGRTLRATHCAIGKHPCDTVCFLTIDKHICGQYDTFGGASVPKPETFVKSESPEVPSLETFFNFRCEF